MATSKYSKGLEGRKFGRWTVVAFAYSRRESAKGFAYYWLCRCDCGNERDVHARLLFRGKSTSCGCYKNELDRRVKSHGMLCGIKSLGHKRRAEYSIWSHIKDRCSNPNFESYHNYGGRGIRVCDRWLNSFEAFYQDMGPRPSRRHSIDRYPDMNGNYEPGNCRWATHQEQSLNRRTTRYYEFNGRRLTIKQWAQEVGMPTERLRNRLRSGWPFDDALRP